MLHPRGFCGWDAWDCVLLGSAVDRKEENNPFSAERRQGRNGAEPGGQITLRPDASSVPMRPQQGNWRMILIVLVAQFPPNLPKGHPAFFQY